MDYPSIDVGGETEKSKKINSVDAWLLVGAKLILARVLLILAINQSKRLSEAPQKTFDSIRTNGEN